MAIYIGLFTAAQAAIALGDTGRARTPLEEGVRLSLETGDLANLVRPRRTGRRGVLGGTRAVRGAAGCRAGPPRDRRRHRPWLLPARRVAAGHGRGLGAGGAGEDGFDDAVDEGRRWEPEQAAQHALAADGARLRLAT